MDVRFKTSVPTAPPRGRNDRVDFWGMAGRALTFRNNDTHERSDMRPNTYLAANGYDSITDA